MRIQAVNIAPAQSLRNACSFSVALQDMSNSASFTILLALADSKRFLCCKTAPPWLSWEMMQHFTTLLQVMPYSTGCTTTLSNFEAGQNYKDVDDPAVTVSYNPYHGCQAH